ncbi:MAG: 3 beta-hydroxysteroid dehydrogenase/Delta 5--_4-isomerase [Bacteroidetes bacterium]|nr:3 beta-hydroxysteroid dehydrogenase/Delta 5-->4-isomerase [Bacteroidota bacterium]
MQDKKILILGGTGHLGSTLMHHLVHDRQVPAASIRIFYLKDSPTESLLDIDGLDYFPGNVLHADDVRKACEGMQIVFHLIGSTTFHPGQKKLQWRINVEGTRNVLDAIKDNPTFEKLCYVSTVNVLAPKLPRGSAGEINECDPYAASPRVHSFSSAEDTLAFVEKARQAPNDDWVKEINIGYYDSKLAAQELVNDYVRRYDLNAVSILPGTMFGAYDYLIGTGMYLISIYHGQMPAVMQAGLPLTHVRDVAEGMIQAIESGKKGEMYILSGQKEDNRSQKEMAAIMAEELQRYFPDKKINAPSLVVPYPIIYTVSWLYEKYAMLFNKNPLINTQAISAGNHYWYFGHEKSDKEIGYVAKRTFREAVREMIAYYDEHKLFEVRERYIDRK